MTRGLGLALALFGLPQAVMAQQGLPALYDVAGVAAGDVLNIRAEPKASATLVGRLPRNAKGVEVVAINADRTWATVNTAEGTGFVALRFLSHQSGAGWGALAAPVFCSGTEPFWALDIDPAQGKARLSDPNGPDRTGEITAVWQSTAYHSTAAVALKGAGIDGLASLRGAACSDGMSDRTYGITVDLFLRDESGQATATLGGCCTLTR